MKNTPLLFVLLLFSSCLTLDENLFNNKKIDAYRLDHYTGEVDFTLNTSFHIPDSLIHLFTLSSRSNNEPAATTIYALYIGDIAGISQDTVILYCHGNRDHMDFYWPRTKLLANTGGKNRYGVLMIDYRGFGMSDGQSTEEGLYADVDAALGWLSKKRPEQRTSGNIWIQSGLCSRHQNVHRRIFNEALEAPAGSALRFARSDDTGCHRPRYTGCLFHLL